MGMDGGVLDFIDQAADAAGSAPQAPARRALNVRVRKRSGKVVGPFDEANVLRMLRGHELMGTEEASEDGVAWRPLSQYPAFAAEIQALMASALSGLGDLPAPVAAKGSLGLDADLPAPFNPGRGGGNPNNDSDLPTPFDPFGNLAGNSDLPVPFGGGPRGFSGPLPAAYQQDDLPVPASGMTDQDGQVQALPPGVTDAMNLLEQQASAAPAGARRGPGPQAKGGGAFPLGTMLAVVGGLALVATGLVTEFVTPDIGAFGRKKVAALLNPPPPVVVVEPPKAKEHKPIWDNASVDVLLAEDNLASYQEAQKKLRADMNAGQQGADVILARALALPGFLDAQAAMADEADAVVKASAGINPREAAAIKALVALARGTVDVAHTTISAVAGTSAPDTKSLKPAERRAEALIQTTMAFASLAKDPKHPAAIKHFDWAMTVDARSVVASLGQAQALLAVGDVDSAVGYMERSVALEPDNVRGRLLLGATLARRKPRAAKDVLQVAAGSVGAKGSATQRAQVHALLSDIAVMEKDFKTASDELKAAVAEVPTDVAMRVRTGELQLRLREWAQARDTFEAILKENPNLDLAIIGSARAKIGSTDTLGAYKQMEDAVAKNPQSALLHHWFGVASESMTKTPDAVRLYKKAESLDPKRAAPVAAQARILMADRKYPAALALLQAARGRVDPAEEPVLRAATAQVLVRQKNHPVAFQEFEEALKADPTNSDARAQYGAALREVGRMADAQRELKQALGEDPRNAMILAENGTYATAMGQYERAIDFLQQAIAVSPKEADLYVRLGAAMYQKGDHAGALEALRTAQSLAPNNPDAFYWMGLAIRKTDIDRAKSLFKQGLEAAPEEGRFDHEMARTVAQEGAILEAVDYLRQAVRKDPKNGEAYFEMGTLLVEQARYADARDQFQRAVEVMPTKAFIHMSIGDTYMRGGEYDRAKREYELAVKKDTSLSEAWCKLGDVMRTDQKYKQAVTYYEKCVALTPKHKDAWKWLGYTFVGLGGKANQRKGMDAWERHLKVNPEDADNEDLRDQMADMRR